MSSKIGPQVGGFPALVVAPSVHPFVTPSPIVVAPLHSSFVGNGRHEITTVKAPVPGAGPFWLPPRRTYTGTPAVVGNEIRVP